MDVFDLFGTYFSKYAIDSFHFFHRARPYIDVRRVILRFVEEGKNAKTLNKYRVLNELIFAVLYRPYIVKQDSFNFFLRTRPCIGTV